MKIIVSKLTGIDLLHKANSFTTGKESRQSLASAYKFRHTTIRTQLFFVECYGIPQYVAYHLRTHFSLYPMAPQEYGWMKSKRTDRGGEDFREVCKGIVDHFQNAVTWKMVEDGIESVKDLPNQFDRYAPTDFGFMVSADGLMLMAEKRLCLGSVSKETREVMEAVCEAVKDADPDLYPHLVPPCVSHGGICRERCCGYNRSMKGIEQIENYKKMFE